MMSQSRDEFPALPSHLLKDSPAPGALRLPRPADTTTRMALRAVAGFFFFTFGYMKFFDSILLGTAAVSLPPGPAGFALYLEAVGVPFPLLNAYVVCLVEMLCGVGLVLSPFLPAPAILTRLCAFPLTVAMTVALLTVGLRNLLGNPVLLDGVPVTAQVWRFPLELLLLLIALLLVWRPLPSRSSAVHSWPLAASTWSALPGMR